MNNENKVEENIYDFRVNDVVYVTNLGIDTIKSMDIDDNGEILIRVKKHDYVPYRLNGKQYSFEEQLSLFHYYALEFNEEGLITSIDYNYRPKRKPKTNEVKLIIINNTHEDENINNKDEEKEETKDSFKEGEYVLFRDGNYEHWRLGRYVYNRNLKEDGKYNFPYYIERIETCYTNNYKYCISFKGNEHLLNTTDTPS